VAAVLHLFNCQRNTDQQSVYCLLQREYVLTHV